MKIALFGGSFNPIHVGHVELAKAVLKELHYQKIIFMTTFLSPFKTEDALQCLPQDRLNMVKLAIEGEEQFEYSSYEVEKDEPSFTIHTVEHLYSFYGIAGTETVKGKNIERDEGERDGIEGKIGLIIGSDQLHMFKKWKNYEKLLELCELIVATRRCETGEGMSGEYGEELDFVFTLLKTPIKPVSSTQIRHVIKEEKNWRERLTPKFINEKVAKYIEENALYGSSFEVAFRHIERLIDEVREYAKRELSEKRFLHSVRVAHMAEHLAQVYPCSSLPPRLAYLAGISHDITKEKPDSWQKEIVEKEGESIDEVEREHLRLLHGRTAAIVLKERFGVRHRSLLDAIRSHTFAHPLLDRLGKILYIADKIEEGRKEAEDLRSMIGSSSIDEIMIELLERGESLLQAKGALPHPFAIELLKRLKKMTCFSAVFDVI